MMDGLQRNGGTLGILAAVLIVLTVILDFAIGEIPEDPAQALALVSEKGAIVKLEALVIAITIGLMLVFTGALYARLRDRAPTRSVAFLLLAVVALAMGGLISVLQWVGAPQLAAYAAKDPANAVPAQHAWLALNAVFSTGDAAGSLFIGAAFLVAGWAIIGTKALSSVAGWVAVLTGAVSIVVVFYPTDVWFILSLILLVVALAWIGLELRRPGPAMETARA